MMEKTVILKSGREKSLLRRHPWIFSGAIKKVAGSPLAGDTVVVRNDNGEFLAVGAYSPSSAIPVRIWSFEEETIEEQLKNLKTCCGEGGHKDMLILFSLLL